MRISAKAILAALVGCLLIAGATPSGAADGKPAMLAQLLQGGRSRTALRAAEIVRASREYAAQLELDLIIYNWASPFAGVPAEFAYPDAVIDSLGAELADPTVNWAMEYFAAASGATDVPIPAGDDPRVQALFDVKTQIKSALNDRESSPMKAVIALRKAAELCPKLYLDLSEAVVLKMLGDHYSYDMARFPDAEYCYVRAAWTLDSAYHSRAASAIVHDDWGTLSSQTGRYANAKEHFTEAARQWEQLAKQDPTRYVYRYRDLAGREYMKAGDAQMATGDTAAALDLMRNKGIANLQAWAYATKSYDLLVRNLIKVASLRRALGGTADSRELLKQAQRASERQNDPLLTAQVYEELGKTYAALGQRANAASAGNKRLKVLKDAAAEGEVSIARLVRAKEHSSDDASLCASAERGAAAFQEMANYRKAAELWRKLAEVYKKTGAVGEELRCLRTLGTVLETDSRQDESLEVRRQAVATASAANMNAVAAELVRDIIQGFVAVGDVPDALEGLTELTPFYDASRDVRKAAWVLESRAKMLADYGLYKAAIGDFKDARARYLTQVGDKWTAGRIALQLAAAQRSEELFADARATLETAIEDIETAYGAEAIGIGADDDRSTTIASLYRELMALCVREGALDIASVTVRKARPYPWFARTIADMRVDDSRADVAKWAKSIEVATGEDFPIQPSGTGERILADSWGEFAECCWWLERQYPQDYPGLPIDPLVLLKGRGNAPEGLVVVEYLPTESSLYVFICGRDRSVCRQVPVQKSVLETQVASLRRTLKSCEESLGAGIPIPAITDWRESSFQEIKGPLAGLYASLVAPIKSSLEGATSLAFALPNGFAGLPMHALISGEREGVPVFLLSEYRISYVARGMLGDLVGRSNRAIDPTKDAVSIFADPEGNLPGAQREATNVKNAYLGSRWFVGPERATATNFLACFKEGGILHVAAHHRTDSNPSGFELLLAPDSSSDGAVGIQELEALDSPDVQLVVLSACESIGSSDPVSSGPARAAEVFSLAGAQSVLGGLWKVSDEAASRVMGDFYRSLSKGKSRSEALQQAQASVIESKQFAHPFFWACFALFGNPR